MRRIDFEDSEIRRRQGRIAQQENLGKKIDELRYLLELKQKFNSLITNRRVEEGATSRWGDLS